MTRRVVVSLIAIATMATIAAWPAGAAAQSKFGIADNSFLVEEAFNQETGIFQNIFVMTRSRSGLWSGSFTQEWPVPGQRHQLSFTAPLSVLSGDPAFGDALINYRLQVSTGDGAAPAFAPRLSLVLPTSAERRGFGASGAGWQVNLPFSLESGAVMVHWNLGATRLREGGSGSPWATTPFGAGSVIVAVKPMFNLMLEAYTESRPGDDGREVSTTLAPGFRTGVNVGAHQWIVGVAVPVTRGAVTDRGVLGYLSWELPFRSAPKRP